MKREEKIQRIVIISIVCASILIISIIAYLRNVGNSQEEQNYEDLDSGYESASTQMGKSINEVEEETQTEMETEEYENAKQISNTTKNTSIDTKKSKVNENKVVDTSNNESVQDNIEEETKEEIVEKSVEVTFIAPVKGEILREFATDSLVYSDTLKEWITHNGVDIKTDKTSVVSASAPGTVYAIKNDPRYGLTVIINHDDGYQTIYSNLLTAEFVVEGEKVEQGQTIGTVGNSAAFEISDDYHLHFELLKDNEYLDPTIYMEFYNNSEE